MAADDLVDALRRLSRGEVHAFVGDILTTGYRLAQLGYTHIKVAGETPYRNEQRMAVAKDRPLLASILCKALKAITEAERNAIYQRWIAVSYRHGFDYGLLWKILLAAALLIAGVMVWNRTLNRRVRERTAQYRQELARRESSEARYRRLVESLEQEYFFYSHGTDGVFTYVSPSITNVLGYGQEEYRLHYQETLTDWPLNTKVIEHTKAAIRGEKQPPYEIEVHHKDGERRRLEVVETPVFDQERKVVSIEGIAHDITAKKQAEDALRTHQQHLTTLLETIPHGIQENDLEGVVTYSNPAHHHMLGYQTGELIGKAIWDMHPAEADKQKLQDYLGYLVVEQPEPTPYYTTSLRKDGIPVDLQVDWTYKRDERGELIGFISVITDVSERKKAEQHLRQAAAVYENTTEAVVITDERANVIAVNRAFTEISGYAQEEVIGRNPRLWKSEQHDEAFYQALWTSLKETDQWRGEIWNRRKSGDVYPAWMSVNAIRDDNGRLTNYIAVTSDISAIKQSQERIQHLAHHDPLTGLPNRLLFNARLEHGLQRADREGVRVAVLFLDLDNFKPINDGLGHPVGDRVLQEVAKRLGSRVRQGDTVARIAGDEFSIILEGIAETRDASMLAEKLLVVLDTPIAIDGRELHVTASIGISLYPDDGGDVTTLMKNADAAMYRAKEHGRNRYCFYTGELTKAALERLEIENALRKALSRNQLEVYFQPQYSLSTGRLAGAEALLRWQHPELGSVSPSRFVPIAESTGLILPIGEWVLRNACTQARAWQEAGFDIGRIAVNVAGQQIQHAKIVDAVADALEASGLDPRHLELEITESFIMQQAERAIGTLQTLRGLGVKLAIDDFGTGYSSLSYLKRLPIDRLKLDRSFVSDIPRNPDDIAIARAVIALGKSLELEVVAEGVESAEQQAFLESEGCDLVQGFLYSRPVPAAEMEAVVRRGKTAIVSG